MGVSTIMAYTWGIRGVFMGYTYVSGMCRVCIGYVSGKCRSIQGAKGEGGLRRGTNIVHWLLLCSCKKKHFAEYTILVVYNSTQKSINSLEKHITPYYSYTRAYVKFAHSISFY